RFQRHVLQEAPWLRVRSRIGVGHLDLQMAEIGAPIAFGGSQLLGMRDPIAARPRLVVESDAVHDQWVALPAPDGVSHPARSGVDLQLAAVDVDQAIGEVVVQYRDDGRRLEKTLPATKPLGLGSARPALIIRTRFKVFLLVLPGKIADP